MPTNYWFPGKRRIRALMSEHGFREATLTEAIGGDVFFRDHPDGRLQMLYVFSWSNFRAFEEGKFPARCNLAVRTTPDVREPEDVAWRTANWGSHHALWFDGADDWQSACDQFASVIMPILDAPAAGAED